jgi:hypothetical protein
MYRNPMQAMSPLRSLGARERLRGDLRLEAGIRKVEWFGRERPQSWARLPWA